MTTEEFNDKPTGSDEGRKDDGGKSRTDLLAPEFLLAVGDVLRFGAAKYDERNWEKGMAWGRPLGAALRHLLLWAGGQRYDEETGLSHLAHAACNVMFLFVFEQRGVGKDDRTRL